MTAGVATLLAVVAGLLVVGAVLWWRWLAPRSLAAQLEHQRRAQRVREVMARSTDLDDPVVVEAHPEPTLGAWFAVMSDGESRWYFGTTDRRDRALALGQVRPGSAFIDDAPQPVGTWTDEQLDSWIAEHE
jgi:hypothetical protein